MSKGPSAGQRDIQSDEEGPPSGHMQTVRGGPLPVRGAASVGQIIPLLVKKYIVLSQRALRLFKEAFRRSEGALDRSVGLSIE